MMLNSIPDSLQYGVLVILAVWLMPGVLTWVIFRGLSKIRQHVFQPEPQHAPLQEKAIVHHQWALDQGFEWETEFIIRFGSNSHYVAMWRHSIQPIVMVSYCLGSTTCVDLVTIYNERLGLTTGNASGGALYPEQPDSFRQIFPKISIDELWNRHLEAENYLQDHYHLEPEPLKNSPLEIFLSSAEQQVTFVQSIPLWPLRVTYWYFTRRFRCGISIEEQDERNPSRFSEVIGYSRQYPFK